MKQKYLEMYMEMAEAAAKRSVAERLKVGCCVVTESGMCSIGLNGTYPGYHTNDCENWVGDGPLDENPKLVTKPQVRHAEIAALDKMLAEGVSAKGAVVFITHSPCHDCAMRLIGAQVKKVYYKEFYRCGKGICELKVAGIEVEQLP